MTSTGQDKKIPIKKRTYIQADDDLIERAEKAMKKLRVYSKKQLAIKTELSSSTINRFFQKQTIQPDSYNQICKILSLEEKIVIQEEKATFTIIGTVEEKSRKKLESIIAILRQLAIDDFLVDIRRGSIKLILEGSQSGLEKKELEKIEELFQSGELKNKITEQNLDITMATKSFGKPQLVVTIPGDFNQDDIDILKDELIDTSGNNIFKKIPPGQMLLLLLLFFFLAMPLILEGIFPIIFQDTPKIENKK